MPLQQNNQVQHHMLRLADMHLVLQSVEFPTLSLLFMTSLLLKVIGQSFSRISVHLGLFGIFSWSDFCYAVFGVGMTEVVPRPCHLLLSGNIRSFRLSHLEDNDVGYLIQVMFVRLHTVLCWDWAANLYTPAQTPPVPAELWLLVWSHLGHSSPTSPAGTLPTPVSGSLTPLGLWPSPAYLIESHLMIVGQNVYRKEGRKKRRKEGRKEGRKTKE